MEYIIFGLTNGMMFVPPSQWIIYKSIIKSGGRTGLYFHIFILSNTVGHIVLYLLANKVKRLALRARLIRADAADRAMEYFYEPMGLYLAYGRCLPFFHSFTSIIAAEKKEHVAKVVVLALIGNYLFGMIIYLHYKILSRYMSDAVYFIILAGTGAVVHVILKRHAAASRAL